MLVYIILSVLVYLLAPSVAHAWGPGTHVEIAFKLLENMALMAPAVRAVIAGREEWFVYGNVAADTIVGKKFAGEHDHCHNWHIGEEILKAARTDREKAAAYGYLAHLAADVVAHNQYIPAKIMQSKRAHARTLNHTYWEMRFDMHVRPEVWEKMNRMILGDFSPFDKLLERVLKRALFSFKTSKKIFSGILAIQRFKQFRRTFAIYGKKSKHKLDTKEISNYMRLALKNSLDYLENPSSAECTRFDPTGEEKIREAKQCSYSSQRP